MHSPLRPYYPVVHLLHLKMYDPTDQSTPVVSLSLTILFILIGIYFLLFNQVFLPSPQAQWIVSVWKRIQPYRIRSNLFTTCILYIITRTLLFIVLVGRSYEPELCFLISMRIHGNDIMKLNYCTRQCTYNLGIS